MSTKREPSLPERGEWPTERIAQLAAHRAVHSAEHNPEAGRIHGYCLVCGVPWPCEYAGTPAAAPTQDQENGS